MGGTVSAMRVEFNKGRPPTLADDSGVGAPYL
jgi:hypothetical protein